MANNRDLQLNSGMRCAKFMLIIISVMFAITAVLLIMVGTTIQAILGDFNIFIEDHLLSPAALLIAIGFIMLFVASLGVYGALKESVLAINMYGVFLFLVFILEVAAAITAFVMQDNISDMLVRTMTEAVNNYEKDEYVKECVDWMQQTFECCGIFSPKDWEDHLTPPEGTNSTIGENKIYVPQSCCGEFRDDNIEECDRQYDWGCQPRMDFILTQSIMLIATGATTVAFVQILGVLCAFMLAKTLRRNKSIREARRWQLQQSLGVLISGGKVVPPMNSPMTGYTQLERSERYMEHDPVTYTASSPSVN